VNKLRLRGFIGKKNTNRIAEIIKTQTVKYKGHNVLLHLVRYSGQNMAIACWL